LLVHAFWFASKLAAAAFAQASIPLFAKPTWGVSFGAERASSGLEISSIPHHRMKSNVLDQFGDMHLESVGNSPQCGQGNVLFAPLHPAHVIWVKVGLFGQLLLAQSSMFPFFTNGCAKNDAVIRARAHPCTQPQTHQVLYTAKRMIYLLQLRQPV